MKPDPSEPPNADPSNGRSQPTPGALVSAVRSLWLEACNHPGKRDLIEALYKSVEDLVRKSEDSGPEALSEDALQLEVYLCSFLDMREGPNAGQQQRIDRLIGKLESQVTPEMNLEDSNKTDPFERAGFQSKPPAKPQVLVLSCSGELAPGLNRILAEFGYVVRQVNSVARMVREIEESAPAALLVDGSIQHEIQLIAESAREVQEHDRNRIPIVLVSDLEFLPRNIEAIRSGVDVYLNRGVDASTLADCLNELVFPGKTSPFRVLIVDDDPAQAEYAEKILSKSGMATHTVTDSLRTLDALNAFHPDLILMDIYMPNADGPELTRIIRGHGKYAGIPIVFMSGEDDQDKQFDVLSVGGDEFLAKPVRPRHLISSVTNRARRAREMRVRLGKAGDRDWITGLLNRGAFLDRLEGAIVSSVVRSGVGGILYLGVDSIEDLQGKLTIEGLDVLFAKIGDLISRNLDAHDVAARFGDYSFAVIAFRSGAKQIAEYAENLCKTLSEQLFEIKGSTVDVAVSIGVCLFSSEVTDTTERIYRAEHAYKIARDAGGNRVNLFVRETAAGSSAALSDDSVMHLIQDALRRDRFTILYQPIAALHGDTSHRYQVLLRLFDGQGEPVPTKHFDSVVERGDLSLDLDEWIVRHLSDNPLARHRQTKPVKLFVSQSAAGLRGDKTSDLVRDWLSNSEHNDRLVFDFLCRDIETYFRNALSYIEFLHELNIRVCLSGFGHDSASVKLLDRFAVDFVRIAPNHLATRSGELARLIEAAHKHGAKVVVPGVDDAQDMVSVWQSGADYVQGSFVQHPDRDLNYDFSGMVF